MSRKSPFPSQQNHPSPSPASWGAETAHAPDAWRVGDAPSARIRASRDPRAPDPGGPGRPTGAVEDGKTWLRMPKKWRKGLAARVCESWVEVSESC